MLSSFSKYMWWQRKAVNVRVGEASFEKTVATGKAKELLLQFAVVLWFRACSDQWQKMMQDCFSVFRCMAAACKPTHFGLSEWQEICRQRSEKFSTV